MAQSSGGGDGPDDITQSIPVPADKIGWIIGKEGSYIKQLEERSKSTVRISDSSSREYGREWKYVQLQGAPRAVDRAKKLLHIRLERLIQRLYSKGGEAGSSSAVVDEGNIQETEIGGKSPSPASSKPAAAEPSSAGAGTEAG